MKTVLLCLILLLTRLTTVAQETGDDTTYLDIPEGITIFFVLEKYIEAIGGRDKLQDVNDRTTVMTGSVQEFDIKLTVYQKIPNLFRQVVAASGLDQVIIYNGEKGIMIMGEEQRDITGEELLKLRFDSDMKLILNPDSAGVLMVLDSRVNIGGDTAYKVICSAADYTWNAYYNEKNFLKVLEEKIVETPSGSFIQQIWFYDYKDVNGIKYPFRIEQKLGPQEITFNVVSIKLNQDLEDDLFKID